MKKLVLAPLLLLAALAAPGHAAAGPCGLPDSAPMWIDFATPDVAEIFGRQGVVVAVSTGEFPAQMRARGAKTVYWDMYLNRLRVGTPWAPAERWHVESEAARMYEQAVRQTGGCATPPIILNELFGAHLETPWTPSNEVYRDNVLAYVRALSARGARPMLLLSKAPYTGSETAVQWWRDVAAVSDIVPEVYFSGRLLAREGPIMANRRIRTSVRNAVGRLTAIGVPTSRIGVVLGFFTKGMAGGREGIASDAEWYRIVKWQVRATRQVAAETKISSVISWGWASYSQSARDLPKTPATACVYVWARNPAAKLCNAPGIAGRFNTDLNEGQYVGMPAGARCTSDRGRVSAGEIASLARVTGDPSVAFSVAYARAAEAVTKVPAKAVAAAERRIVQLRFGGNRARYVAALRASGANVGIARAAIADELRREKVSATLRGRVAPSEVATFYASYPELTVRAVQAKSAVWWLGNKKQGLAVQGIAPPGVFSLRPGRESTVVAPSGSVKVKAVGEVETLGAVPLAQARPAIAAALSAFARRSAFEQWTLARQRGLLPALICRQDVLPQPSTVRVSDFLPFLALDG